MNNKKKVGVLHGAISNSGDFLIRKRGMELLEKFIDPEKISLIQIERWKEFDDDYDALIILGGPLITRRLHKQARNIKKFLETHKVPVICFGLGIQGAPFDKFDDFFIGEESVEFWKGAFESSKLFSVRDKDTHLMLKEYGIQSMLTGCPAFYHLDHMEQMAVEKKSGKNEKNNHELNDIIVTIPYLDSKSKKNFILTLFLIFYLKFKIKSKKLSKNVTVISQHAIESKKSRAFVKIVKSLGFKIQDASNKSLDEIQIIRDSDIHLGTRLHANIYSLSTGRPSFLLNIDNRTNSFLNTINTPSGKFSLGGIKNLVNRCLNDIDNSEKIKAQSESVEKEFLGYYTDMQVFMTDLNKFLSDL